MSKLLSKQLLLSDNFWVLNKSIVKSLGLEAAFLLSNFSEAERLSDDEGWFYQTIETVEKITTLSRHKQEKAIKSLVEQGILIAITKGMPRKRYFKIDYDVVANLFVKNSQTSLSEIDKQQCEKSETSKESIYKENNNKENNIVASKEATTFEQDSFEMKVVDALILKIRELRPTFKEPNKETWAKEVDRMIRLDKRTQQEIVEVLQFATNDPFWQTNILSTAKLRKQFDRLAIQASKSNKGEVNMDWNID